MTNSYLNADYDDHDSLLPDEGWFPYWKTSSSLWESKLSKFTVGNPIFIPINWAFHSHCASTILPFGTTSQQPAIESISINDSIESNTENSTQLERPEHSVYGETTGNHFATGKNSASSLAHREEQLYDFGTRRPETNLKYLIDLSFHIGLRPILLVPLTPIPFLPNGGVPISIAKTLSLSPEGLLYGVVDAEGHINKFYSFFDPRVYRAFGKFVWELGNYLNHNRVNVDIIGLISGHAGPNFRSFLHDSSRAFEHGLIKYMEIHHQEKKAQSNNSSPNPETNKEVGKEIGEELGKEIGKTFENEHDTEKEIDKGSDQDISKEIDNDDKVADSKAIEKELLFQREFHELIKNLYLTSAKECLGEYWLTEMEVSFLGGGIYDLFSRALEGWEHPSNYFPQIMNAMAADVIPSSLLLPKDIKQGILSKMLNEIVDMPYLSNKIEGLTPYEDDCISFIPLVLFELFGHLNKGISNPATWENMGLTDYLNKHYQHMFLLHPNWAKLKLNEFSNDKIFFCLSDGISESNFYELLKIFMNGGQIVLDTSSISSTFKRKLELFLLENSIVTQKINYICDILYASIGQGRLITFEGKNFHRESMVKKHSFWENLISYFNPAHLQLSYDPGTYYFWKIRRPYSHELNFEDIRRILLFNPTSYKKYAKIILNKNFTFLKMIDEININGRWGENEILLELLPNASVALDFGHSE